MRPWKRIKNSLVRKRRSVKHEERGIKERKKISKS